MAYDGSLERVLNNAGVKHDFKTFEKRTGYQKFCAKFDKWFYKLTR